MLKFRVVLVRFLLLRFTVEFYNRQMKEVNLNIQPLLKEIFRKFDGCENCATLAIQMKNDIKNATVANSRKLCGK